MLHLKRIIIWSAAIWWIYAFAWAASADTAASDASASELPDSSTVQLVVNDRVIEAPASIVDGCTMVPLRAVAEAMGGQITADASAQHITMSLNGLSASFTLGSREVDIERRRVLMSRAACLMKGSACVPLRFFVDSCGARLDWSEDPKIAYLYARDFRYKNNSSNNTIKAIFLSPRRPLTSGDTLIIEIAAAPALRITVDIEGVKNDIPTYEERPGRYKAEVAIDDTMRAADGTVIAKTLKNAENVSLTARYKVTVNTASSCTDAKGVLRYSPAGHSLIASRRPNITVSYDNYSLQKNSVHLWFDEQEYTHQINYRSDSAVWRPASDVSFGRHHVRFAAKDSTGSPICCDWYFSVVPDREVITDSEALPVTKLRISSPRYGDSVNDIFSVIGRATAGSDVTITVREREGHERGIVSSPGIALTRTVKADLTGRFQAEFDVSAIRAGHRLGITAEADMNSVVSEPFRIEVVRR